MAKPKVAGKSQKEIDKELRKFYEGKSSKKGGGGTYWDEDEDDRAARKGWSNAGNIIQPDNSRGGGLADVDDKEQQEDIKFEAMLRDYNNQLIKKQKKKQQQDNYEYAQEMMSGQAPPIFLLDKPIDLPYFQCMQLPEHLKWINVHGVSNSILTLSFLSAPMKSN